MKRLDSNAGVTVKPRTGNRSSARLRGAVQAILIPALLWLGAGCRTAQPVTGSRAGAPSRPVACLPFELAGNHIYLAVRVNGAGPFSFVLDTGAGLSVVNRSLAKELKLKRWPLRWRASAWAGWTEWEFLRGVQLELGDIRHRPWTMASGRLPDGASRPLDGLLGADLFLRFVVELDFEKRELRLFEPSTYRYAGAGAVLPFRLRHRIPVIDAELLSPAGVRVTNRFDIDTGSGKALALASAFFQSNQWADPAAPLRRASSGDAVGRVEELIGRLPEIRLGPYTVHQPTVSFELHPMVAQNGLAGTLGTPLLRRFQLVFEYRRRRLYLTPNRAFGEPFEQRWTGKIMTVTSKDFRVLLSGAELVAVPPHFDTFTVDQVRKDSPAEAAGLQRGDRVLTLDGKSLSTASLEQWFRWSWRDGAESQIEVQRGALRFSRQLILDWENYWAKP